AAEPRFFMLETIREYADEQLRANGETATTEQRHAYYYLQLAETAATHWFSKERDFWCERLDPEDANLRKALAWCKAEPRAGQAGLRMATALLYHWFLRDSFPEGGSWLRNMLARTDSTDRSIVRGHAITGLGWAQWFEGDYDAAATSAEEAVSIARENGGA